MALDKDRIRVIKHYAESVDYRMLNGLSNEELAQVYSEGVRLSMAKECFEKLDESDALISRTTFLKLKSSMAEGKSVRHHLFNIVCDESVYPYIVNDRNACFLFSHYTDQDAKNMALIKK